MFNIPWQFDGVIEMRNSKVILRSVLDKSLDEVVGEVLEFCDYRGLIKPGTNVVIKPNLCTERKDMIPTANTSYVVIESVVKHVRDLTDRVSIVESDGARYTVEQAFENNGIYELGKRYDLNLVNLSRDEQVWVPNDILGKWNFGKTFLEADVFITIPTLKTHATTVFTGAIKNQWGCVPRRDRLVWHKYMDRLLSDIANLVPPRITVMDGIIGMQGRGPINGYPINANVILGGNDPVAVDATSMRLIGLDPYSSGHIRIAAERGVGVIDEDSIEIDGDFEGHRIDVEPAREDWAIKLLNLVSRSEFLTKYLVLNDNLFYPVRSVIIKLRKLIG